MARKSASTKLFVSSTHSFWAQFQHSTTFIAKVTQLIHNFNYLISAQLSQLSQLSQKLKVWRKKFIIQSFSDHKNTPYRLYPGSLRPSEPELACRPNYAQLRPIRVENQKQSRSKSSNYLSINIFWKNGYSK